MSMRLEMAEFPVRQLKLGNGFQYRGEVLEVDENELINTVCDDPRIGGAEVAVVVPGEKARVTGVRDVVEPRIKAHGTGQVSQEFWAPWHRWETAELTAYPGWPLWPQQNMKERSGLELSYNAVRFSTCGGLEPKHRVLARRSTSSWFSG